MVNTNVLVSVHPAAFVLVEVYVPDAVYVVPFTDQVYASHAVADCELEVLLLMVNTNVLVSVHPAAFVLVEVYVPDAVYVVPLLTRYTHHMP